MLRLGRPFGIAVELHWTFALLVLWVAWTHLAAGHGGRLALEGVVLVIAVFGCVVLHELGHALTARRFGIATRSITLYPFGGVARLDRLPTRPGEELLVALAGPAVNVALAAVVLALLAVVDDPSTAFAAPSVGEGLLPNLFVVNVAMAVFNLLPAFPMDGGRVLRAVLALRLDRARATRIAATVGQALAMALGLLGLVANPMLLFVALFVYVGAEQEARAIELQGAVAGAQVADAMQSRVRVLPAEATLRDAVEELLAGDQQDFPLVDVSGVLVGMLRRDALLRAMLDGPAERPVSEVADRDGLAVRPGDDLSAVLDRMSARGVESLPVVEDGRIRGLLTGANLAEWVAVRRAVANTPS